MPDTLTDALILSGNFGGGHNQLAAAISHAFSVTRPAWRVRTIDFTGTGSPGVSHFLEQAYQDSTRWFPAGYSLFYWLSDIRPVATAMKAGSSLLLAAAMRSALSTYNPKVIICTYPIPAAVIQNLRDRGVDTPPLISVITDAAVHNMWINPSTDAYIVPCEEIVPEMLRRGVAAGRIHPLGLPLLPGFDRPQEAERTMPERPRVLILGGAMGHVEYATAVTEELLARCSQLDVTIVAGRNARAVAALNERKNGMAGQVTVLGYVDDMAAMMDQADVVVAKPGGTSVFEAMSRGLPVIAYRPIWGQEESNARFLEGVGAGKTCWTPRQVATSVEAIIGDPGVYARMRTSALQHTKPRAARAIADFAADGFPLEGQ